MFSFWKVLLLIGIIYTNTDTNSLLANDSVEKSDVKKTIQVLEDINAPQPVTNTNCKKTDTSQLIVQDDLEKETSKDKASLLSGSFLLSLINPDNGKESFLFFESKQFINHQNRGESVEDNGFSMNLFAINNTMLRLHPEMSEEELNNLSKEEWSSLVESAVGITPTHAAYGGLQQVALTREILFNSSEEDILSSVAQNTANMNYLEKAELLKRILATLEEGYDDLRTIDGTENAKGSVSLEEVFATWRFNVKNPNSQKAGVCRDMANAAVKIAEAMGIPVNYGLGFQTTEDSHHRIVILSEGQGKGLDKLNYGGHIRSNGERGIKALEFNGTLPSNGLKYRLYNHYSELATILPSELGVIINEVTGGEQETLTASPLRGYSKHQVGYQSKDYGRVRVFHTKSARGEPLTSSGVAYDIRKEFSDFFEISSGAVAYHASRSTPYGTLENTGVGLRVAPKLKLELESEKTGTRFKLHLTPQHIATLNCSEFQGSDCTGNTDTHTVLHSMVAIDQDLGPYVTLQAKAQGNTFYSNQESTDSESPVVFRTTNYSLMGGVDIHPSENWRITASGSIIYTDLGDRISQTYMGEIGVEQRSWGLSVGAKTFGTPDETIPEFIPGAESLTTIQATQRIDDLPVKVGGYVEVYHDNHSQNIFGISLSN